MVEYYLVLDRFSQVYLSEPCLRERSRAFTKIFHPQCDTVLFPNPKRERERERGSTKTRICRKKMTEEGGTSMSLTLSMLPTLTALLLLSGVAEIGGGWLVWQHVRERRPWYFALCGSIALVVYGFLPTLQPLNNFGRLYAVYGGVFIILSFMWGRFIDGVPLDRGDILGSAVALCGVLIMLFYRSSSPDGGDTSSSIGGDVMQQESPRHADSEFHLF